MSKRDIKDVYHDLFDDALNAYNAKQKRKDRKIDDYYKHVQKSKNLDLQREFIVTVGNKADWERLSFEEKQEVGQVLGRYVSDFNDRHSNMTIYNAIVHLDENGAPHAHFNVVPTATGYKNGLALQPSFRKALEQEGFGPSGREQFKAFRDAESIVCMSLSMKLELTEKLVRRTILRICVNTRRRWNTSKNRKNKSDC